MARVIHLRFQNEPRIHDRIDVNGRAYDIKCVAHHGGSNKYTLDCLDAFAQGVVYRVFSAELAA